jgi:hypothetical protein
MRVQSSKSVALAGFMNLTDDTPGRMAAPSVGVALAPAVVGALVFGLVACLRRSVTLASPASGIYVRTTA